MQLINIVKRTQKTVCTVAQPQEALSHFSYLYHIISATKITYNDPKHSDRKYISPDFWK